MSAAPPIHYRITPANPGAHLFSVSCTIANPDACGQQLSLPVWIPGSYLVRDFARNIVRLSARHEDAPIAVNKLDKSTWQCAPCDGPLTVTAEIYAHDLSVRGAHLDTTHGFFNGTSVFLRVHGREDQPCGVQIDPPEGEHYHGWRVATAMRRDGADSRGFGAYAADSYDELIDHPVEMGEFALGEFEACGVPHSISITGRHDTDMDRLCTDLKQLCEHHIRFFGEPAPMERYLFLTTAVGDGYGGLEHRASSSLMCKREELPRSGVEKVGRKYRRFLGLCSHEYFHLWNVKRIKPAVFTPYDLTRESHTSLMWVFEGVTSYYDDLALVRSGLISVESYLELLAQNLTRVWRTPGRHKQSLAESSFDAWTKLYKRDENAPNSLISYYTKGAVVALALDLTIRQKTAGRACLDDVTRAAWREFGTTGAGMPEDGFEKLAAQVTGLDLTSFFDTAIRGTGDPPIEELFAFVGVECRRRAALSRTDTGGKPRKTETPAPPSLGVDVAERGGRLLLAHVLDGGSAQTAGLSAGDELAALNGLRITPKNYEALLGRLEAGDEVRLDVFRRDELMTFTLGVQEPPLDTFYLVLDDTAGESTLNHRTAWLGSTDAIPTTERTNANRSNSDPGPSGRKPTGL